jgi:DNA repair exonuclease SbcCD ATPase subunit
MCDNLSSENSAADENAIIDTNVKLQSSIDRILSMFEETSKQLSTSNSIQNQLAEKLLDNQKEVDELKIQLTNNLEEYEEKNAELMSKLRNFDGLTAAYELDMQRNKAIIAQLEQNLSNVNQQLNDAKNQIECEKIELTNLESVRKDLEAQRTFFTQDLQDSEIKRKLVCELFRFVFIFFEDFSFSWSWHTFGLIEKSFRVFIFDCRCCFFV